ncbi:hypothetical protein ANO11243_062150 [Dothideomycetidae sp. 11243]|nr:hypothetical protein ANO11243_062150 [fungal sp. No.11243]
MSLISRTLQTVLGATENAISTRSLGAPYRKAVHPQQVAPPLKSAPDLQHEVSVLEGGRVEMEKDVAITMRDGVRLYADVYRPISSIAAKTPTIIFFAPFGKHGAVPREKFQNMGVDFGKLSKYAFWELPDALRWCGDFEYSFLMVDPRGTWWSEGGEANYFSPEEGRDGYDIVEWTAKQNWCTGAVGWGAVSYYAMSIYQTAVLKPPHLKAIMAWEGISDIYREVNMPGGIPNVAFQQLWMDMTGNGLGLAEDHAVGSLEHPLYDSWWQSKVCDWSKIDIPALSVTGWSSLGLHLRGTIEAWKAFSSPQKFLLIHAGREWSEFYKEHNIQKQEQFFDRFLKNQANEVDSWPVVQYAARTTVDDHVVKTIPSFPPEATYLELYLSANKGQLHTSAADATASANFVAQDHDSILQFDHRFDTTTEITGHSSVKLFVQAMRFPDVDLYVALQKMGKDGKEVKFYHSTQQIEASASFGWLRVSHRELDPNKSRPERPYHAHQRRLWLRPADIVECDVEIWPSSTIWEAGETLRLSIKGNSFTDERHPTQCKGPSHGYGEVKSGRNEDEIGPRIFCCT